MSASIINWTTHVALSGAFWIRASRHSSMGFAAVDIANEANMVLRECSRRCGAAWQEISLHALETHQGTVG